MLHKELAHNSNAGQLKGHDNSVEIAEETTVQVLQQILQFAQPVSRQQGLKWTICNADENDQ